MVARIWTPYCGAAPVPSELLSRWNADPVLLSAIAGVALAAVAASDARRRRRLGAIVPLLLLLFASPFCALTSALFSARVVHHLLLTIAVAPLAAALFDWRPRRGLLVAATALQALIFWAWHAPPAYAAALSSDAVYWLMQASLLGAAIAFWGTLRSSPAPAAIAALLATMVQMGLLGALITFAQGPLYAPHIATTLPWGLSAIEDQQLAGLIMWVPAAGLYLGAAMILSARVLSGLRGRPVAE